MRGGRILIEKSPNALLTEYNTTLLEDIVLQLCKKDVQGNYQEDIHITYDQGNGLIEPPLDNGLTSDLPRDETEMHYSTSYSGGGSINRLKALIRKNTIVMTRNLILLIFMIVVPAIQIALICVAIGNDPKRIKIGFVNHETNYTQFCLQQNSASCITSNLSCRYLLKIPSDIVHLIEYKDENSAREAVKLGETFGFMTFPITFSDHFQTTSQKIFFEMDMTSKQIAASLKRVFYETYNEFVTQILRDCGADPRLSEPPLQYLEPIYGSDDTDFREFIAPSILLGLCFFFPLISSGISYILDKKQGTLERSQVAGVQTWEIMAAFFITEFFVLLIQSGLSFSICVFLFGIHIKGSYTLAMLITIIMGLGGVSLGFLIASFCNEEIEAALIAMATFFPNFLLAGMLWPVQGMPQIVQYFSYLLPCTLAGESIRSIISRGWGFTHPNVWKGFATSITWILIYFLMTLFVHRVFLRKK